ncbi:protein transport protein S31 [Ceratobasidium sp. UAMH 11750]|nr:protein transport protein S31 [Ceratobasidium sp. UAMH 11750]
MTEDEELAGQDAVSFCAATGFVDPDLTSGPKEGDYALAPLCEQYLEYAGILVAQGMISEEERYVERAPAGFGEATWLTGAVEESTVGKANGVPAKDVTGPYGVSTTTGSYEGGVRPSGVVTTSARFNRLAWGYVNPDSPEGVIAAGLESGQLELWDPAQISHETDVSLARLLQNSTHTGPVRALHFNTLQHSLLASGGTGSEL